MKWFRKRRTRRCVDPGGKHGSHPCTESGARRHGHQSAHLDRLRAYGGCPRSAAVHDGKLVRVQFGERGTNWTFVNPFHRFPATAGGFCCDQIVLYNAAHRIWIWLLQYISTANGDNIFRLAVCREAQFGNWYYWDFAPTNFNAAWNRQWFDYPDMAFTNANLFVTFNMFHTAGCVAAGLVLRFPLTTLASGGSLGYRWWATTNNGSIRLCRGAGATMYMGSHNSVSQIRVLQWPDSSTSISWNDVNVRPWSGGAYSAPGPGGVNWLGRLDQRITGAWVSGGTIGFMWSANRDASHPLP